MSRIDVIHAARMKPGDLFAGIISPDAPTTPVQTWAAALTLATITPYTDDNGRRMLALSAGCGELTPVPAATQVLVIRL
jgi:hypothetical protein